MSSAPEVIQQQLMACIKGDKQAILTFIARFPTLEEAFDAVFNFSVELAKKRLDVNTLTDTELLNLQFNQEESGLIEEIFNDPTLVLSSDWRGCRLNEDALGFVQHHEYRRKRKLFRSAFTEAFQNNDISEATQCIAKYKADGVVEGYLLELCTHYQSGSQEPLKIIHFLLKAGANVNTTVPNTQDTLLMWLCRKNQTDLVATFLEFHPNLELGYRVSAGAAGYFIDLKTVIDIAFQDQVSLDIVALLFRSSFYNDLAKREQAILNLNLRHHRSCTNYYLMKDKVALALDILLEDRPGYSAVNAKSLMVEPIFPLHQEVLQKLQNKTKSKSTGHPTAKPKARSSAVEPVTHSGRTNNAANISVAPPGNAPPASAEPAARPTHEVVVMDSEPRIFDQIAEDSSQFLQSVKAYSEKFKPRTRSDGTLDDKPGNRKHLKYKLLQCIIQELSKSEYRYNSRNELLQLSFGLTHFADFSNEDRAFLQRDHYGKSFSLADALDYQRRLSHTSRTKSHFRFLSDCADLKLKAKQFLKREIRRLHQYENSEDKRTALKSLLEALMNYVSSIKSIEDLCHFQEPTSQKNFLEILNIQRDPGHKTATKSLCHFCAEFKVSKQLRNEILNEDAIAKNQNTRHLLSHSD